MLWPLGRSIGESVRRDATGRTVSIPQFRALKAISEGIAQPSELARRMGVTLPAATSMLDGLEAQGLVERKRGPVDRRAVYLSLTPAADPVMAEVEQVILDATIEILSCLDAAQQERLLLALGDLEECLSRRKAKQPEPAGAQV